MRIVVAGGTGTLGRLVVEQAHAAGHEAVGLSRATGTDLMTGENLAEALRGADAVVDVTSTGTTSGKASVAFFTTVTRRLLDAERAAGVPHHVAISIVGAASVAAAYYAGKAAQEALLAAEPGGWSLLRTTQFHEFVRQMLAFGKVGPLHVVPTMRTQPLAAADVAAALVVLATGEPRGVVPDLAGPREERMADLVRRYLAATGPRRPVLEIPLPGAWGRGMRDGSILPGPDAQLTQQTFDAWLAEQPTPPTAPRA